MCSRRDHHGFHFNSRCLCLVDADEKVKEHERVEALRERAQLIVESERTDPGSHQYHKYMHIVQRTDSNTRVTKLGWEGITGRVKRLLEMQDERVKQLFALQDERVKELLELQHQRAASVFRDELRAVLRQQDT